MMRRLLRLIRPRFDVDTHPVYGYGVDQQVRRHRDAPLSPRARAVWWLFGGCVAGALLAVVIASAR